MKFKFCRLIFLDVLICMFKRRRSISTGIGDEEIAYVWTEWFRNKIPL